MLAQDQPYPRSAAHQRLSRCLMSQPPALSHRWPGVGRGSVWSEELPNPMSGAQTLAKIVMLDFQRSAVAPCSWRKNNSGRLRPTCRERWEWQMTVRRWANVLTGALWSPFRLLRRDGQLELLGGEAKQLYWILSVKRGFAFQSECRVYFGQLLHDPPRTFVVYLCHVNIIVPEIYFKASYRNFAARVVPRLYNSNLALEILEGSVWPIQGHWNNSQGHCPKALEQEFMSKPRLLEPESPTNDTNAERQGFSGTGGLAKLPEGLNPTIAKRRKPSTMFEPEHQFCIC